MRRREENLALDILDDPLRITIGDIGKVNKLNKKVKVKKLKIRGEKK